MVKQVKKKEKHVDEKEKKLEELTDLLKRIQADFENYKKRVEKEQKEFVTLGKILVIKRLLGLVDSFDEAMKHKENAGAVEPLYKQLLSILEDFDCTCMNVVGENFDPHIHECVCEESSDKPKGKIVDEIQKGYIVKGFVVRHAKVKVSKGMEEKGDDNIKEDSKA